MKRFSIIIPTWKNLRYLELALKSIRRNSAADHEVIVFFNEFDAECERWLGGRKVIYERSEKNLGVCGAVNRAAAGASADYIVFMNDDMYVLPGWDTALAPYLVRSDKLWLSGTAIEAGEATACYIGGQDYGDSPDNFREDDLLRDCEKLRRPYDVVSTWTPILIPRANWEAIRGFDENYFPGYGSDPDLAMKMYDYGCRHFIGVGSCLVYHFSRRTISRFDGMALTDPKAYFRKKWGFSWRYFLNRLIFRDSVITPKLQEKIFKKKRGKWLCRFY